MSDQRTTPANDRVAHISVAARFPHLTPVEGTPSSIAVPVADLLRAPAGALDRQAVWGEGFEVLEDRDGWCFGTLARDGYAGWVRAADLGPPRDANHGIAVRGSHLYPAPDIKAPPIAALSFGSRFRVVSESARFMETEDGAFIPKPHLRSLERPFSDPVTIAQIFFGTPYLWGGNSGMGIDCSGLVQAALLAAGVPCPGDSDLQEAALGTVLEPADPPRRGDLYFWKGHVAMAVDSETLIHANAHHMAVAYEGIATAIARIAAQDGGPVTSRRRL